MKTKITKLLPILFLALSFNTVFAQWTQSTGLVGINCQRFIKLGNTVFAGTSANGMWKSIDDGLTWTQCSNGLNPSTDYSITELTILGNHTIIAATYNNGVFKSNDYGSNWTSITGTLPVSNPAYALASNTNMIIVGIESQGIYYTTDSGTTWTQANTGWTTNLFFRTLLIVNSNVFACTQDGVFTSSINTFSWSPAINGLPGSPPSTRVMYNQNDTLYLGTSTGGIYRSLDQGQNWTSLNTSSTQTFRVSTIIVKKDTIYFASNGSADNVYKSSKKTINWTIVGTGLASSPNDIIISNTKLLAATGADGPYYFTISASASPPTPTISASGTTLTSSSATGNQWYLNGSIITSATSQNYTAAQNGAYTVIVNGATSAAYNVTTITGIAENSFSNTITIYPNPTSGIINIQLGQAEKAQIKITDVLGNSVYAPTLKGANNSTIDLSAEANGVYFISIQTNEGIVNKKIVISK